MNRQIVFVHGRAQEHLDSIELKAEWVKVFREGLAKSNLSLQIADADIRFPYYGDTLYDLDHGFNNPAQVIVRGDGPADEEEKEFLRSVLEEVQKKAGIDEQQLIAAAETAVLTRDPQNWGWVRAILTAVDKHVPGGSGAGIAVSTHDVYEYLRNPGVRDLIESGVRAAMKPGVPTVVVAHSLGTVVAYNLLRREGKAAGWIVPLFVTLGSPLAVTAVKRALRPIQYPECVSSWYNAMDKRDIVSLYPLDSDHFGVNPAIENNQSIDNPTSNRHGISGYLNDKAVAQKIYEAMTK